MTDHSAPATEVPPPHEGVHYANPSSKPLKVPASPSEREGTQRLVWKVFFVLVLCVFAMVMVMGLVARHP